MAEAAMTKTVFAKLMGVDKAQPTRWAALGMPILPNGRVDGVQAAAWVRANVDPQQRERRSVGARQGGAPPGVSYSQQFMALKVQEKEQQLAVQARDLLHAQEVWHALTGAFATMGRTMHGLASQLGRRHGLPDDVIRALRASLADAQRTLVVEIERALQAPPEEDPDA